MATFLGFSGSFFVEQICIENNLLHFYKWWSVTLNLKTGVSLSVWVEASIGLYLPDDGQIVEVLTTGKQTGERYVQLYIKSILQGV